MTKKIDPRIIRTTSMLKKAVYDLLVASPDDMSKLTVTKITAQAGLNRATFYLHYADVRSLLRAIVYDIVADFSKELEPFFKTKAERTPQQLALFLRYFYDNRQLFIIFSAHPRFTKKIHVELRDKIALLSEESISNPKFRNISTEIMTASIIGIIMWWITEGLEYDAAFIAEEIKKLYR
ncbi:TetR/AcrR family transcriptional regulator [Kurthia sibirica]|uniref:TetR/AcrR family transcriptional regulator n=1 Tax=Kurthia sibirica TaxID=202750 RepID=A0A2U3APH2_9BACL|nr:TetR/AcrR family transcriptional regulator [Kurthia sibirica]PWI26406.1 TetR/AcrR family transcriptional regulator [Kurthia sibirica]GEK34157.1 TetR family transcriptional regulator [Kurthia sibirica]